MNSIKWALLLCLIIVVGCRNYEDDDFSILCPEFEDIGPLLMAEETKELIPYEDNIRRLIFEDQNGIEKTFSIDFIQLGTLSTNDFSPYPCSDDPQQSVFYNISYDVSVFSFYNGEYGASIYLEFSTQFNIPSEGKNGEIQQFDRLFISRNFNGYEQMYITIDKRNSTSASETIPQFETFEFRGDVYEDVYAMSFLNTSKPNLYYSLQDGIIGFKSEDNSISLKFVRAEYF